MNSAVNPPPASGPASPPSAGDRFRAAGSSTVDFARQIRLALGIKGVAWASAAGLVGTLCCAVSLAVVAASLDLDKVEEARGRVATYRLADQTFRNFMDTVHVTEAGALPPASGRPAVHEGWRSSNATLDAMCGRDLSHAPDQLPRLCADLPSIRRRLTPSIEAFDPPRSPLPASSIDDLLSLGRRIDDLASESVRDTEVLIGTMSTHSAWAILVLTLSTAGFAGAGFILIVLVGRASMRHYEQWQATNASAERAERLAHQLSKQVVEIDQSRHQYEALVESLSDLALRIDAGTGTITFANKASLDLWGVPPDKLVGTPVIDYVAPEDRERVLAVTHSSFDGDGNKPMFLDYRVTDRAGQKRHVEGRFRKTYGLDGRSAITGVIRDVDRHVQLAEQLRQQAGQLQSIVESSGALIVLLDRDFKVVMVNAAFAELAGIAPAGAVGRRLKELIECQFDEGMLRLWSEGASREPMRFANRLRDQQGRVRHISCTATPIADSQGGLSNVVFLGIDDTDRLEAEQALFDSQRYATVGEMAAAVAHELAQPLQVINLASMAALDELTADATKEPDRAFLTQRMERIASQVARATDITGELRAFVRGTAQDLPDIFELSSAVRAAAELVRHGLTQSGGALTVLLADDLPAIRGHSGRLEQVFVNLINNARDAGAKKIDVSAHTAGAEAERRIFIRVENNGPNIPEDILPQLFEKFITTKPRGMGTGLGLRICRRIVEDMGGSITAANRREGGALFEIVLPAATHQ